LQSVLVRSLYHRYNFVSEGDYISAHNASVFSATLFFGFRPGFSFMVRVGFFVSLGIAHDLPNNKTPSILPDLHHICTWRYFLQK
jgi:hypothetical protein